MLMFYYFAKINYYFDTAKLLWVFNIFVFLGVVSECRR